MDMHRHPAFGDIGGPVWANGKRTSTAPSESQCRRLTTVILVARQDSDMAENKKAFSIRALVEKETQSGNTIIKGYERGDAAIEAAHGDSTLVPDQQPSLLPMP